MLKQEATGQKITLPPCYQFIAATGKNNHAILTVQVSIAYTEDGPQEARLAVNIKSDSYQELEYHITIQNWNYSPGQFNQLYLVWEYFPEKLNEIKVEDEIFRCSGKCESGIFVNGMKSQAIHLFRLCSSIPVVPQFSNATVYSIDNIMARPSLFS
jgi:hypothetical protein